MSTAQECGISSLFGERVRHANRSAALVGQIAAICRSQAATLATRNTNDFIDTGISLLDPRQEITA
ncbi:hypothetical protein ODJ79_17925 [Actinoplanes sp. KI2]|uniref:hypothetical protein n=1 Tax=Actinoplanes sp. KI2 TaxID=2983315 RepID=UPI0021D5F88F|nr:hypothetical protein [Actinoplanes sp. KI2]MCU7725611.1 hypothetical protein [Actinoplanes sp. KI2]